MTDRMAALERVAEAAREMQMWQPDRMTQPSAAYSAWGKLNNALDALRFAPALPAEPVGETVDVWGYVRTDPEGFVDGRVDTNEKYIRDRAEAWSRTENGPCMGTVFTARVPLPSIPTVAARVEG